MKIYTSRSGYAKFKDMLENTKFLCDVEVSQDFHTYLKQGGFDFKEFEHKNGTNIKQSNKL